MTNATLTDTVRVGGRRLQNALIVGCALLSSGVSACSSSPAKCGTRVIPTAGNYDVSGQATWSLSGESGTDEIVEWSPTGDSATGPCTTHADSYTLFGPDDPFPGLWFNFSCGFVGPNDVLESIYVTVNLDDPRKYEVSGQRVTRVGKLRTSGSCPVSDLPVDVTLTVEATTGTEASFPRTVSKDYLRRFSLTGRSKSLGPSTCAGPPTVEFVVEIEQTAAHFVPLDVGPCDGNDGS